MEEPRLSPEIGGEPSEMSDEPPEAESSLSLNNNAPLVRSRRRHVYDVCAITAPIIASEIFQNTLPIVDLAFVGRALTKEDLAAAALATVWFNLWHSCMIGYLTALDTLLSQSYGAREYQGFAVWTGTSLVWVLLTTVLISALVAICGPVMKLFGQDSQIAENSGEFSFRLIPGLFPYFVFKVLVKYLQTQDILWPGVFIGIFANLFNILFNWLLIFKFDMGLAGAPWATTLTRSMELVLILCYMLWRKRALLATWPRFVQSHFASWKETRPFRQLAASGALAVAAEAWSFEITVILAGLLGTVPLDAHIITLSIATFIFLSFPFAIGIAASIRVGQLTGEGLAMDAQRSCYVSMTMAGCLQAILCVVLLPCSNLLGDLFSSDPDVADLVTKLIPLSCIFMLGDAIQAVVGGVLRGIGRQTLVLQFNVLGFWLLAIPIGSVLTFPVDLGVFGLWWGFVIGIYSSAVIGLLFLKLRVNWVEETVEATKRVSSQNNSTERNVTM